MTADIYKLLGKYFESVFLKDKRKMDKRSETNRKIIALGGADDSSVSGKRRGKYSNTGNRSETARNATVSSVAIASGNVAASTLYMDHLIMSFREKHSNECLTSEQFLSFCTEEMSDDICKKIFVDTKDQSVATWVFLRCALATN